MSQIHTIDCWEPAKLLKRPNNIQSSDYTNWKPFVPSYEEVEERPSMGLLLSMEYGRVWRKEMEARYKDTKKEKEILPVRPYIARGLNLRKQNLKSEKLPLFKMKNVASSVAEM